MFYCSSSVVAYLSSYITRKRSKHYNELALKLSAIRLLHQDGVIQLSAFPNGTTSKLAGFLCREVVNCNFNAFVLTRLRIKPDPTALEADALITQTSDLFKINESTG